MRQIMLTDSYIHHTRAQRSVLQSSKGVCHGAHSATSRPAPCPCRHVLRRQSFVLVRRVPTQLWCVTAMDPTRLVSMHELCARSSGCYEAEPSRTSVNT